jgi:hypothetical protein
MAFVRSDVSEAIGSTEMSVLTRAMRRNIPEDGILHKLKVFENRKLRGIFGPKRDEVTGGGGEGNCVTRGCVISAVKYNYDDVEEDETGGARTTNGRRNAYGLLVRKPREKN